MDWLRDKIQQQVFRLNGLSLNEFDISQPPGDAGLYGPDSVIWRVHGDFTSMLCGGISALLMQMLHPLALAGVWDHSTFRDDMLGRLRRTSQFVAVTTFGNRADAHTLIERVRRIHLQVTGVDAEGNAYAASDPALLTWVHVAEASRFLAAHLRYKNPRLSAQEQDRYYAESARVAEALGARDVPKSQQQIADYLQSMRPQLRCDARTREVTRLLMNAPAPSWQAKPVMKTMMLAGIALLPDWAQQQSGFRFSRLQRFNIDSQIALIAGGLRWSVRNGAYQRAMRRMGRDF
ncbi:oxygenase MpaB family protein [Winslowiella iniecta]|uniref:Histidine kinase n=1 Tax=Winslowiella iniecta TaxID=1560201 RepID=A0A0L7TIQ3_9GAMM|nr:oxygenase MpaB family protein [Winslowiella iniecta]KOC92861.1 histidine kinase [Winslowiella iniecta]KOC95220.1 histidine kinase [Winslowiella iniecta]